MKFSRILATGAAAALVGVSTLAVGGSAAAADFYIDDADIGFVADGDAYLDSWFSGDVAPGTQGTAVSVATGLQLTPAGSGYQLLNGTVAGPADLPAILTGASFTMSAGNATFQVPMFYTDDADADTNVEFTTLRPADPNTLTGDWVSSQEIVGGVTIYAPNTPYDLTTLLNDMPGYEILAFGIFANSAATVSSVTWEGNTYYFTAPAPTATITPASLTVADFSDSSKGVTGVFTGFQPGETVTIGLGTGSSGGPIGTATADTNGVVTYTYVSPAANASVGTYTLVAVSNQTDVLVSGTFTVVANPAVLAATGADFTPAIVGGGLLLLIGAGFVIAARRAAIAKRH